MKRTALLISGIALLASLNSCTELGLEFKINEDYDLSNVKIDKVSGLEGLVVPIGSTAIFSVSDYLNLDEVAELIKTDDEGNFYITLSNSELLNQSYTVDSFTLSGYETPEPYKFGVNSPLTIPEINLGQNIELKLPFDDVDYSVEIRQANISSVISGIKYVDVTSELLLQFQYDKEQVPFEVVYIAAGTSLEFPEWIILGQVPEVFTQVAPNKVEFKENTPITDGGISLLFPIDMIDFRNVPEDQGVTADGNLYLEASAKLSKGNIIVNSDDCTVPGTYTPSLSSYIQLDPMTVDAICLSDINLGDAVSISQEISLSESLPELLYSEGIVLDLEGLKLKINLNNGLPFSGKVNTQIDTYSDGGASLLHNYKIDFPFYFDPEGLGVEYVYTESGENSSIKVDEFDSLLNPAPDFLRINAGLEIDSSDEENYGVITPGSTYTVKCGYEFIAPLSFGQDFLLSFTQDFTDLGVDVETVEGLELSVAEVKFNLVTSLPFDFEISAQPLDAEGNVLDSLTAEVIGEIKGGSVESPMLSPVTLKLTNNGPLNFDGVRLSLKATVSQENAVLNKNQFIQLRNISISLPEGAGYTLPEVSTDNN
jgi:hypothetical protein